MKFHRSHPPFDQIVGLLGDPEWCPYLARIEDLRQGNFREDRLRPGLNTRVKLDLSVFFSD